MAESICVDCEHKRYCPSGLEQRHNSYITGCSRYEKKSTITNGDHIRAMSDEELADWFVKIQDDIAGHYDKGHSIAPELPTLKESWLDWLREPVGGAE